MLKTRPKGPKSESKSRSLSEVVLSEAVGILFETLCCIVVQSSVPVHQLFDKLFLYIR